MIKQNVLDLLKYIITTYLQCFIIMSIIISTAGAIMSNNLWWLLFYVFQLWISVEVTFFAVKMVYRFVKKIKDK